MAIKNVIIYSIFVLAALGMITCTIIRVNGSDNINIEMPAKVENDSGIKINSDSLNLKKK